MTLDEIKKLQAGDPVGYRVYPDSPLIDATVIQNGPRLTPEGQPVSWMQDVLIVQLGAGPGTVSWEPDNFPQGIPQLEKLEDNQVPEPVPAA